MTLLDHIHNWLVYLKVKVLLFSFQVSPTIKGIRRKTKGCCYESTRHYTVWYVEIPVFWNLQDKIRIWLESTGIWNRISTRPVKTWRFNPSVSMYWVEWKRCIIVYIYSSFVANFSQSICKSNLHIVCLKLKSVNLIPLSSDIFFLSIPDFTFKDPA